MSDSTEGALLGASQKPCGAGPGVRSGRGAVAGSCRLLELIHQVQEAATRAAFAEGDPSRFLAVELLCELQSLVLEARVLRESLDAVMRAVALLLQRSGSPPRVTWASKDGRQDSLQGQAGPQGAKMRLLRFVEEGIMPEILSRHRQEPRDSGCRGRISRQSQELAERLAPRLAKYLVGNLSIRALVPRPASPDSRAALEAELIESLSRLIEGAHATCENVAYAAMVVLGLPPGRKSTFFRSVRGPR